MGTLLVMRVTGKTPEEQELDDQDQTDWCTDWKEKNDNKNNDNN